MRRGLVLAALLAGSSLPVLAVPEGQWTAGVYGADRVANAWRNIPYQSVIGGLNFQKSWMAGVVARREIATPGLLVDLGRSWKVPVSSSVELGAYTHQAGHRPELSIAWRVGVIAWRPGPLAFEFGIGGGLSHIFGTPLSDGHSTEPELQHRTLLHFTRDLVLRHADLPEWSLGLRVHHRSGAYGLIAPARSGSNFIGLILTRDL
ncbi:MAG: hypothetical protein ABI699_03435 [Caldimonas sp.]